MTEKERGQPLTTELLQYLTFMPQGDDLVLIVLKGHLLVEQQLEQIIQKVVAHGAVLDEARFTFAQKVLLAKSMCWSHHESPIWNFIEALNTLRNDIAHSLGSDKTDGRLQKALNKHEATLNPKELLEVADYSTANRLKHAVMITMGFLGSYLGDAMSYRRINDETQKAQQFIMEKSSREKDP